MKQLPAADIQQLERSLNGEILLPGEEAGEEEYESARKIWMRALSARQGSNRATEVKAESGH
jgi:hypothetical protein